MAKKSNLIHETLMYSVDKGGGVVTHHLPYARGNPLLEIYTAKGFTYEKPVETKVILAVAKLLDEADVPDTGDRKLAITDKRGTHIIEQGKPAVDEAAWIAAKNLGKALERAKPKRKYHRRKVK